jgi:hypothetical protein
MVAFNFFDQFMEDLDEGIHDLGSDQLTVALCSNANAPVAGDSVLADLTEIAYTNLSSRNITTSASAQTSGIYKLDLTDLTLTASGAVATFRHVVIYNNTPTSPADPLIGWADFGSDVTLADTETFVIDFNATNGLFRLGLGTIT